LGAIGLGMTLIGAGEADLVIAGGYDAVSEYAYAGFDSLRLIAHGPVRPFGAGRTGMKTSEGFAALVLEPRGRALARGARSLGVIAGIGESADAHHLTMPHPAGAGAAAAVRAALAAARLEPTGISLISAHATATPGNDAAEHAALAAVFGDALPNTPVVAFKSHLGHTLGGAGAVELVLSIMARERGLVPPTINSRPIDPALTGLLLVDGAPRPRDIRATVNLSMGFGGANTCVIMTTGAPQPWADKPAADQAVITGVGVILAGAIGNDAFAQALTDAGRGHRLDAGPIAEDAIAHLISARRVRRMSDYAKLTLAATAEACRDAAITDVPGFAGSAGALLGTNHGSVNFCEAYYTQVVREGMAAANPVLFAEGVPNAAAAQLSLTLGIRGGCQTLIGSRTAGLDALRLAAARIRDGSLSRIFVGAAEEWSDLSVRAHTACGIDVPGGFAAGAVTFILESRREAQARGARIRAVIDSGAQRCGHPAEAAALLLRDASDSSRFITALGPSAPDLAVARAFDAERRNPAWSIGTLLPETFSVGPLAALAAALTGESSLHFPTNSPHGFAVLASDFCSGASLLNVKVGSLL
jgi:3-oxoacyl-[acyl-carrier-protein] synthase II